MEELWKDIPNTSGRYQISNTGRCKRTAHDSEYTTKNGKAAVHHYSERLLTPTYKGEIRYTDDDRVRRQPLVTTLVRELFGEVIDIDNIPKKEKPIRKKHPKSNRKTAGLAKYKRTKLKILRELGLHLTEDEESHLWSLETETQIDAFARRIIMR